jgi:hypothetical protein
MDVAFLIAGLLASCPMGLVVAEVLAGRAWEPLGGAGPAAPPREAE